MAGLPVITTPYVGDCSALVKHHKLGYVLKNPSYEDSLISFIKDVSLKREIYRKRTNFICKKKLTWDAVKSRIAGAYLE
jgi:hypothetical protein